MITKEKESVKTLDQIAEDIALEIKYSGNSERVLDPAHRAKLVNAGIVQAGQVHHPELAKLRKLVYNKVLQLS